MIQKIIDNFLAKEQEENKNRMRSHKFSPSLLGRCYRAQCWNRKDEPITNPPDERTLRVFKVGKIFHNFVENIIKDQCSAQCEVKAETEDVLGYADIVTDDTVLDLKSQHSRAFWHMQKSENIEEKKETNILQVLTYAWILKKPNARLVFISKDDLCILEYGFTLNDKWRNKIKEEFAALRKYWKAQVIPPAEPRAYKNNKGEFQECKYCNWQIKCQEMEKKCNPCKSPKN